MLAAVLEIAICVLSNVAAVSTPLRKTMCPNELTEKCSLGLSSHCIPDENDQYKHICSEWKWIPKDRCPYYNSALQNIDSYPCDTERLQGCPKFFYKSYNLSEFDACYLTLYYPTTSSYVTDSIYIILTDKPRDDATSIIPTTRYENSEDYKFHIGISVGVYSVTLLCFIVMLCCSHRRMTAHLKKFKGDVELLILKKREDEQREYLVNLQQIVEMNYIKNSDK